MDPHPAPYAYLASGFTAFEFEYGMTWRMLFREDKDLVDEMMQSLDELTPKHVTQLQRLISTVSAYCSTCRCVTWISRDSDMATSLLNNSFRLVNMQSDALILGKTLKV